MRERRRRRNVAFSWGFGIRSESRNRREGRMIEGMAQVHMTEAEVARDLHAVLEKVREGVEVIIEQDYRPVAVIRTPPRPGRPIDECSGLSRAYEERLGLAPVPQPDFSKHAQDRIYYCQRP